MSVEDVDSENGLGGCCQRQSAHEEESLRKHELLEEPRSIDRREKDAYTIEMVQLERSRNQVYVGIPPTL